VLSLAGSHTVTTAGAAAPLTWKDVWNKLAARPCSAGGSRRDARSATHIWVKSRIHAEMGLDRRQIE